MKELLATPLALLFSVSVLIPAQDASKDAAIAPPESLVLDGIPKLPATLAEAAGRYADYRTAFPTDWYPHPERKEMLIATRFGNTYQAHSVEVPAGARQQLTFFAEPVYGGTYPPTDGDYFMFSKDVGGGEWYQL